MLKKHGIAIYNANGDARPADEVLHEPVQLYIAGDINLNNLTK